MAHAHSRARGESGLNRPWRALQCCGEAGQTAGLECRVMSLVCCILGYISDFECCDDAMILCLFAFVYLSMCVCV
jgi:hypothetical protein